MFVHPILIHHGLPLAAGVPHDVRLSLTVARAFNTGLVRLDYQKTTETAVQAERQTK